jgi:hypothetical protein
MFSETHHGYPEHPKSVSEMVSEYPTLVQNPAPAEERQRKTSFNEAEEIESNFTFTNYWCKNISYIFKLLFFRGGEEPSST